MIRSQMCQVFFDMFDRIRNGSRELPTTWEVLEAASVHSGIMPYMSLRHPQANGDCDIEIFAPAWRQWLELPGAPRSQSDVMGTDAAVQKSGVLLQVGQNSCGFHEIGKFSFHDQKSIFVETVSLPAQSNGTVMNVFGFGVPLSSDTRDARGQLPAPSRQWLDLGHGVPAAPPPSMLPLAA